MRLYFKLMMKRFFLISLLSVLLWSCGDDGIPDFDLIPPRPLGEVALENDAEIIEFLETHFYNADEFENPPADFDFRIRIDTIAGENSDRRPLMDDIQTEDFTVSAIDFGLDQENAEDIPHTLYYLIAREGSGGRPTFTDSTFVRIQGTNLQGGAFQPFNVQPMWFDLTASVRGFTEGVTNLMAGGNVIENPDGTFEVEDYGVGLVILPSGLGFFNNGPDVNLPPFASSMFTIDLFSAVIHTDHDNDGIPSFLEDLDNNRNVMNDNTDVDTETFGIFVPNFLDADDDNDGILTRDEIIINADGTITFPDSDGDGTPDHLDND